MKNETLCGHDKKHMRLGQVVATPGAMAALQHAGEDASTLLERHQCGDWGDVDTHDWQLNDTALRTGDQIVSAYTLRNEQQVWVITEADRSATTLLLPEDY